MKKQTAKKRPVHVTRDKPPINTNLLAFHNADLAENNKKSKEPEDILRPLEVVDLRALYLSIQAKKAPKNLL
jgi:hypothetical protein